MDYILVNTATLSLLYFVCYSEAFNHTKFCVKNPNNTLCLYPDDGPGELCKHYESKKLGKAEKRDIILWHMQIKENALKPESKHRVYWDSILSAIAERWASRCNVSRDLNRHFGNNTVDEHIFSVKSVDGSSYSIRDILKMSEYRVMYHGTSNFVQKLKELKVFRIGCGMSIYAVHGAAVTDGELENGNAKLYELVCNYLPVINGSKHVGEGLEIKRIPRNSQTSESNMKKPEKNLRKSQTFSSVEEATGRPFGLKFRGQYPKLSKAPDIYEDDEEFRENSVAEEQEDEEDGEKEEEEEYKDDDEEELSKDVEYEYVNLSDSDGDEECTECEGKEPVHVNEIEKEIERKIDEEFGPFKGFLISTENYGNLSAVSVRMDFRLNKVFQDFEHAGARVTSKGKFVLWAIRDSNNSRSIEPKMYILFACFSFAFLPYNHLFCLLLNKMEMFIYTH